MKGTPQQVGVVVNISAYIREIRCSNFDRDIPKLAEDFRCIPQSLEANPVVLFKLGHDS
jgi:hypothetical protein